MRRLLLPPFCESCRQRSRQEQRRPPTLEQSFGARADSVPWSTATLPERAISRFYELDGKRVLFCLDGKELRQLENIDGLIVRHARHHGHVVLPFGGAL